MHFPLVRPQCGRMRGLFSTQIGEGLESVFTFLHMVEAALFLPDNPIMNSPLWSCGYPLGPQGFPREIRTDLTFLDPSSTAVLRNAGITVLSEREKKKVIKAKAASWCYNLVKWRKWSFLKVNKEKWHWLESLKDVVIDAHLTLCSHVRREDVHI